MMLKMEDFEDESGHIDWKAYEKAQKNNGDVCYQCGKYIIFGGKGYQTKCNNCDKLKSSIQEIDHDSYIRCPFCAESWLVDWDSGIHSDGEHQVSCNYCEKDFEISTRVSFSFTSPPLEHVENE